MSNREGYVYEVVNPITAGGFYEKGDIVVMSNDDGSNACFYKTIKTDLEGVNNFCMYDRELKQLWPVPEKIEDVETITLMGKEYDKTEIENALKDVMPIAEGE